MDMQRMTSSDQPPALGFALDSRCQLMLEVTSRILSSDPDLRLCEGLRLIEATRTALGRMAPESVDRFDSHVVPRLRTILFERFGISPESGLPIN
jgi:hypothetical protein